MITTAIVVSMCYNCISVSSKIPMDRKWDGVSAIQHGFVDRLAFPNNGPPEPLATDVHDDQRLTFEVKLPLEDGVRQSASECCESPLYDRVRSCACCTVLFDI